MNNLVEKYASAVVRHRWLVIMMTVFVTAIWVFGASRLGINPDIRVFFSEDNPQLLNFEALENTYTKNDNIFIAISTKDDTSIFNKEALEAVEEVTKAAWTIPYSSRVDSITSFKHSYADGDEIIVEDLVRHAENLTQAEIDRVKRIARSEPLLLNRLITKKENVTGINIDVVKPADAQNVSPVIAKFTRNLIQEFEQKYPQLEFHLTGWVMIDSAMGEGAERDMKELIPFMFLLLILVMGFLLKSFAGTFVTVLVMLLAMLSGMGMAGWTEILISGPSSTAPPIILTLALADSVHILLTIFFRMDAGEHKHQAIIDSLKANMTPLFVTSATTLLGFLTMNFSDAPPFRDLGNIVAMGIGAAFVYSVTFLPAMMAVLLPEKRTKKVSKKTKSNFLSRHSAFVIKNQNSVFWGTIVVSLVVSLGASKIELNDDFIRYFDESYEYRVDSEFVMNNLTGLYTIEYSLNTGISKGIHDPDFLKNVEKFVGWYEAQPEVAHVNTLLPILKKLNMNIHADDPSHYRIPSDQMEIAQYLLLYELSLPFGQDLNNQIDVDKSALRMTVSLTDVTANDVRAIDERARNWLKANAPEQMFTHGTGLAVMYAHLSERNIKSMLLATFGALVLISFFLIFAFRSVKYGLMSLIPNLMPAIMAFGVWGLTMERIGMPAAVLVSLAMGIVVDDTVHFISKYLHARRHQKMSPDEAINYTFESVGKALVITTVTLVIGFSVLSLSGYKPNSDMGIMTGIIISLALVFDFLFLPSVLLKMERFSKVEESAVVNNTIDINESSYAVEGS